MDTHDFITRARNVHGDYYDYSVTMYKNSRTKIKFICPVHGEVEQWPLNHLNGSKCALCAGKNMTTKEFVRRANIKHNNRYDYTKTVYMASKTPVYIVCKVHGQFSQLPNQHLYGYGCKKCAHDVKSYTLSEFVELANRVHNKKYTYSNTQYNTSQEKVSVTCPVHGDFKQMPYAHLAGKGCPSCSAGYNQSSGEREISEFLTSIGIEHKTNDRSLGFELDIYIPEFNVAIEFNGLYWHSELNGKCKNYHNNKTEVCKSKNIHLIHIWDFLWYTKNSLVKSRIRSILGLNKRVYARNTRCKTVTSDQEREFLSLNHIQGYAPSSVKIGLYDDSNTLLAIMTFSKPRFSTQYKWELLRYCSKQGVNVVGGASKLFSHFKKHHSGNIISYSCRLWNTGKLYKMLGFAYVHTSKPSYHYTKDYTGLESRVKYQKHKLENILATFDQELTEWQNMQANKYDRVWDCGTDTWEIK